MDKEFLIALKKTLQELDERISVIEKLEAGKRLGCLEHLVNDDILGGLKGAADQYLDDENYSIFVDTYKPDFEPFIDQAKFLHSDDPEFDLGGDLYDKIKELDHNAEGFDEKQEVARLLDELKSQIEETRIKAEQLAQDLSDKKEEVIEESEDAPEVEEEDFESEEFWSQPDALDKFRAKRNKENK